MNMLRSLKPMRQYIILASDGYLGGVHDFYFHDDSWVIRYMVVDIGNWLAGRKVLLTTEVLGKADWDAHTLPVNLTRDQIEKSPEIDTDKPVSRRQEAELHKHFGWRSYWNISGADLPPALTEVGNAEPGDPHLRSFHEVTHYSIHAIDGPLGHIDDFIVEDAGWVIRYLVVNLSNWAPARKVLISPQWMREINFAQKTVEVALAREAIVNCPEFHPTDAVNREYEERLYDYYGRPIYWTESGSCHEKK
ncbi:MAG TPA: PRC-barrel domain containing protein [Verrucomicrobiae bacterium]|jgi:hypothetical protein|nr:PRC-barrel domain containing protein [Verrucomicrobiae bacterium]